MHAHRALSSELTWGINDRDGKLSQISLSGIKIICVCRTMRYLLPFPYLIESYPRILQGNASLPHRAVGRLHRAALCAHRLPRRWRLSSHQCRSRRCCECALWCKVRRFFPIKKLSFVLQDPQPFGNDFVLWTMKSILPLFTLSTVFFVHGWSSTMFNG